MCVLSSPARLPRRTRRQKTCCHHLHLLPHQNGVTVCPKIACCDGRRHRFSTRRHLPPIPSHQRWLARLLTAVLASRLLLRTAHLIPRAFSRASSLPEREC